MKPLVVWAVAVALACTTAAQAPKTSTNAAVHEWGQFRGNSRLSGVATSVPPASLKLRWTYEAGDAIESSAAIANGTVYVGSAKGELLAVDLSTGKLRWKYATGGSIGESSPAVGDGAVFVGDLGGMIHAVSTGDEIGRAHV